MKIYITGLNGDIGSIFKNYLKKKKIKFLSKEEFEKTNSIDLFVHLGASSPRKSFIKIFVSNILKNIILCLQLRKKKINKFIFFSSVEVYGKYKNRKISENTKFLSPSFYGISKIFGEMLFIRFLKCNVLCLRCPAILGKNRYHYIGKLINKMKFNQKIVINRKQIFFNFFVHPFNIFEFILNRKLSFKKDIVNICVNPDIKFKDIIKLLKRKTNTKSKIIFINQKKNTHLLINNKIKKKYGFKPFLLKKNIDNYMF